MKTRAIVCAAAVLLAPVTAFAQSDLPSCNSNATRSPFSGSAGPSAPYLWAIINSACTDLSGFLVQNADQVWTVNTPTLELGSGAVRLHGQLDTDPFISFGATTTNLTLGPVTYAFLFGTPVVPGLYNAATATGGVSVTNGARGNTTVSAGAIYPTFISGYGTVGFAATNLGVDLGTSSCNASGTPFTVTTVCGQGTTSNTFGLTFYDNLEALLTYTQNDAASVASWSGAVTLTTTVTPEPAAISLVGMGLVFVSGVAIRRRKG